MLNIAVGMAIGVVGVALGQLLDDWLDLKGLGWVLGAVIAFFVLFPLWQRVNVRIGRRRLLKRGVPNRLPVSVGVSPESFSYAIGGATTTVRWEAITSLQKVLDYWVVEYLGTYFFVPRRFLREPGAEAEFLAAFNAYAPEDARQRSRQALAARRVRG